jgi:glycosyltransferase involved in cell wall biosynthesis
MKVAVSNPSVGPHVKQNVIAYFERNKLNKFFTTFFYHPSHKFYSLLSRIKFIEKELRRRQFGSIPINFFENKPLLEILRSLSARQLNAKITDLIWYYAELKFDKWVAKMISKKNIDAIHTYEHCALETLKKAKKENIFAIYEQTSVHHKLFKKIIETELIKYPTLITTSLKLALYDKPEKINARKDEEIMLADIVICNSSFTKNSLIIAGVSPSKIAVVPLGFPEVHLIHKRKKDTFIFMYAGNLTFNKGIHILLEVWNELQLPFDKVELHLYGAYFLPEKLKLGLPKNVHFFGNIRHEELMDIYQNASVFVNPTLADGFGMVITEAMASGLPVIASKNSAAPDLIIHEIDGLLVEAGSKDDLLEKMLWSYNHKDELLQMGLKAKLKAQNYGWPAYRKKLIETIERKLN